MIDTEEKLVELVRHLVSAKQTEEQAKVVRISIEEKIAALIPGPERGQVTQKLEGGTSVCVERGFHYKTDIDGMKTLSNIPFLPIKSKTTIELDSVGYEWYRQADPESFAELSKYVVATPKKIAVTVKAAK